MCAQLPADETGGTGWCVAKGNCVFKERVWEALCRLTPASSSGEGECRTHFNLSYRSDFALLAIADREVGIDIEQVRTIFDVDAFCSSYFHRNEKAIIDQALPSEQADTIFTFWAFKEAFIKCLGIGFSRDLTEFDLSPFYHSPTHELLWWNGETFTIERIEVVDGYVGAVAYKNQ